MRKIIALLLSLTLLLTLCACGAQPSVSDPPAEDAADAEETAAPAGETETPPS